MQCVKNCNGNVLNYLNTRSKYSVGQNYLFPTGCMLYICYHPFLLKFSTLVD